ncbi:hypothetical protein V494_08362 [Pseudogymnoascus sp. VKM F-4513 (FW-928)]|nr:hypothetical protein V494_08362 [Pseudogymnoascus sp. VKM F-4513 (FW-928)]
MSHSTPQESTFEVPFQVFAISILPLYLGPQVTIRIGSTNHEGYKLSKALICKQSPYFAATFEGGFKEGEEQSMVLEEIDGVVTIQSFQMLVQWLYHQRIIIGKLSREETITTILEFVRLADMCGVSGMEAPMAERIKEHVLAVDFARGTSSTRDNNTPCITLQHIASAALLPTGHPVRGVLAAVAVREFCHHNDRKFMDKAEEYPDFAVDLLKAMRTTFKSLAHSKRSITFKDPLSGEILEKDDF